MEYNIPNILHKYPPFSGKMGLKNFCIYILSFHVVSLHAQQTYRARVVDAETGEALPYVNIYVAAGRGTMTNAKGDFLIQTEPSERLTFRYVGYEKVQIAASELSSVIRMKPYTKELGQVVVEGIPTYFILRQTIKRLASDYRKHKREKQVYYFRSRLWNGTGACLMEAFLQAGDAVNGRKETLLSGIQGIDGNLIPINITNIQRHIEIGARTYRSVFWRNTIKPLDDMSSAGHYYSYEPVIIRGEYGRKIYCIDCRWKDLPEDKLHGRRYITGRLYIEDGTYRLLRVEGRVNNAWQWTDFDRLPSDIHFHITYDHSRGYTSVAHLAVEGGNERMQYHTIAFAVPEYKDMKPQQKVGTSNLAMAIRATDCDSTLWTEEIVRRTEEEERIFMKGMESVTSP